MVELKGLRWLKSWGLEIIYIRQNGKKKIPHFILIPNLEKLRKSIPEGSGSTFRDG